MKGGQLQTGVHLCILYMCMCTRVWPNTEGVHTIICARGDCKPTVEHYMQQHMCSRSVWCD